VTRIVERVSEDVGGELRTSAEAGGSRSGGGGH
jgi:hypothetical protein